jgi:DNA-binding transcriptional MerR regulator
MHNSEGSSVERVAPAATDDALDGVNPALAAKPDSAGTIASADEIPDKLYFRIGDVAKLAGIKPYVLRFWETEFPGLGPKKSGTGHRLYRRKDVQLVFDIKTLLYEKRFTIEGARKFLETRAKTEALPPTTGKRGKAAAAKKAAPQPKGQAGLFDVSSTAMDAVRKELEEILLLLK